MFDPITISLLEKQNKLEANVASQLAEITPLSGTSAPTTSTVGVVKQLYINTATGDVYVCRAAAAGVYTWVRQALQADVEERANIPVYNVSAKHPTSGINGTRIYTLATALAVVPATYIYHAHGGKRIIFADTNASYQMWEFVGSNVYSATDVRNWRRIDSVFGAPKYLDVPISNYGAYWSSNGGTIAESAHVCGSVNVAAYAGKRIRVRAGSSGTGNYTANCYVKNVDNSISQIVRGTSLDETNCFDVMLPVTASELLVSWKPLAFSAPPFVCYDAAYNAIIAAQDSINTKDAYIGLTAKATATKTVTSDDGHSIAFPFKTGCKYRVTLDVCTSESIRTYLHVPSADSSPYLSTSIPEYIFVANDDASTMTTYIGTYGDTSSNTVTISVECISMMTRITTLEGTVQTKPQVRALILGDSYSTVGNQTWITPCFNALPAGSKWTSLAVTGATIRDNNTDRTTYPYTSRPTSGGGINQNTLACQIEKLKRLMAGTDLDAGETQLYSDSDDYPNVVIIQGGHNDMYDSSAVEATYTAQIEKLVEGVYIARKSSDTPEIGNCYIKTPDVEVNRTCFAGAYRHIMDEISTIFPDAQVFIVTCTNVSYRTNAITDIRYKIAEQQRKCAKMLSASLIDWHQDGQINGVVNNTIGSGTAEDPYLYGAPSLDTFDNLHPNVRGGKKLGQVAAQAIINNFMAIS